MLGESTIVPIVGRDDELSLVGGLLESVNRAGAALIVHGAAGVGKTTLLAEAARRAAARGLLVLRATGVQSEAHLPLAGLHQLLRPLRQRVEDLPPPQRDALQAAFGLMIGDPPDPFLVALATLTLLGDAAAERPVMVLAEDAQWLDAATTNVLTFVARRLESDPIVLLISARTLTGSPVEHAGLPEMLLAGLDRASAAQLLDARGPELDAAVRERLLDLAEGNPLALVELPTGAEQLPPATLPPDWLPLTMRLEQAFAARAEGLSEPAQALLLVAALSDRLELAESVAAASLLVGRSATVGELAPAVADGLVSIDEQQLWFRHSLVRSAIHQGASPARRRAAHAALAQVLGDQPERALWHRAASTTGHDEELARELEAAGTRASRFREITVAVAAFERAAQLSDLPERRGARLLLAAERAFEMGRHDIVTRLMQEAEPLDLTPLQRARMAWLRELFHLRANTGNTNIRWFVDIVDGMRQEGDVDLAIRSLLSLALSTWWTAPNQQSWDLMLGAAERLLADPDDARMLAILALVAPVQRGNLVIDRIACFRPTHAVDPEALRLVGLALSIVGSIDDSIPRLAAAADGLRVQGRLGLLAQTQVSLALSQLVCGDWAAALTSASEAARLAQETAQSGVVPVAQLIEAVLCAARGAHDRVAALVDSVERVALPLGIGGILAFATLARGWAALASGRHSDAFELLGRLFDERDPAHHPFVCQLAVLDIAEAATGCSRNDDARVILGHLEEQAAQTHSRMLRASLVYARAVLAAPDTDPDNLFRAALDVYPQVSPFLRARVLLAYGAWLRRHRRPAESRSPLRAARDTFDALGAEPWSDRARTELRAAGEVSDQRMLAATELLTAQEMQVAQLAATGLTNRQIGERLYLSHRTVGAHLRSVFPKLGVTARTQLGSALSGRSPSEPVTL